MVVLIQDSSMNSEGFSEGQKKGRPLQGRNIMQKRGNQVRTITRPKHSIWEFGEIQKLMVFKKEIMVNRARVSA